MVADEREERLQDLIVSHAARNQQLASTIRSQGVNLDNERLADIHFWSPDETTAGLLADALTRNEFGSVQKSAGSEKWSVSGQIRAKVTTLISSEFTELLVRLADKHNSVYDGWGTTLIELAPNTPSAPNR